MAARAGRADPGFYPEREVRREAPLDRLLGEIGFGVHAVLRRGLRPPASLVDEVARHAVRFRASALPAQARELRYRLRRDGLERERLAECFGLYAAALPPGAAVPAGEALAAAAALVHGSLVDLADARSRWQALALAATAFALCGVPVHLYAASEARARAAAAALNATLGVLGSSAVCIDAGMSAAERRVSYGAPVVCGSQRVIAFDYLRDRIRLGRRLRPMQSRLERLSGDTTTGVQMLLSGLHCALVEDAEQVLLDDARVPMVISADVESSPDRLPYEQALELARALEAGADYTRDGQVAQLTARGAQRLAQLSVLLGGLWAARQRREELVAAALTALHVMECGRDYEVEQGALRLAPSGADEEPAPGEALQRLLEVKERLAFAGRRDVLARLSVPRFFRRYLRLAGACADARGLEREFWSLYGLRTSRAGAPAPRAVYATRGFVSADQRRSALGASVREHAARGQSVVVALRSVAEADAVASALQQAGVRFVTLSAAVQEPEREALASLDRPGSVLLSLHPAQRSVARTAGGDTPLHLAIAELHDSARHVAQVAQAYAAGSCEQFLALEDEALASLVGTAAQGARAAAGSDGELSAAAAARIAAAAQEAAERAAARARREMSSREQSLEDLLAFSGHPE
jgi:preprotein translocase subunit SecA